MTDEESRDVLRRLEALEARLEGQDEAIVPGRLYTAPQVAERLGCSLANVYGLMGREEVAVTRVGAGRRGDGKGLRVRGSDLVAFLESRRSGGPSPRMTLKHLRLDPPGR